MTPDVRRSSRLRPDEVVMARTKEGAAAFTVTVNLCLGPTRVDNSTPQLHLLCARDEKVSSLMFRLWAAMEKRGCGARYRPTACSMWSDLRESGE